MLKKCYPNPKENPLGSFREDAPYNMELWRIAKEVPTGSFLNHKDAVSKFLRGRNWRSRGRLSAQVLSGVESEVLRMSRERFEEIRPSLEQMVSEEKMIGRTRRKK